MGEILIAFWYLLCPFYIESAEGSRGIRQCCVLLV
jgi:hypothetical protein